MSRSNDHHTALGEAAHALLLEPERLRAIWNGLAKFEQDVLAGKHDGKWGAAIGQACEVLQNHKLFDENYEPTPLGQAVIATAPTPAEPCVCGVLEGFVCAVRPGPTHNRSCAHYRRVQQAEQLEKQLEKRR